MKKNSLNVFERFAQAYFKFVNGEDQRYLVRINGVVVTEVITSKDELKEAVEGALTVNEKSEIEVYMVTDIDLFEDEEETTDEETEETTETPIDGTPVHVVDNPDVATAPIEDETPVETEEEAQATEEAIGDGSEGEGGTTIVDETEADEAPKDLPRNSKSVAKAEKKAAKLAKKAKKKAKKKASKVVAEPEPTPVVEKTVKKTVKKTTTSKTIGSTQSVQQLHLDTGAVIATFDSVSHAAKALGINATNISKVINGHRKSTGGFGWKKV